jgi:hypothetical protein
MGDRRRGAPEPAEIENYEDYKVLFEETSQTKLILIDCYQEWCGPTLAMQPFWDKIWSSTEKAADRLSLHKICINSKSFLENADLVKAINKGALSDGIRMEQQGCKPFFVLLRFAGYVGAVDGVSAAALELQLDLHTPKLAKKEDDK